ncbi:MAG: redoxin domain-containing protein [Verrucomicrobiae bacterium]|nr:redoxin domain-containing protein [Verrucomicrobiae bacterium]
MKIRSLIFAFVLPLYIALGLQAEEVGLKVGEKAPGFGLMNQQGKEISLKSLLEENDKVALAFFRSADWCPFCKRQLIDLQKNLQALEDAGLKLVGISYDSVEVLGRFSDTEGITFTLLSDLGSKTIEAYKVRNEEAKSGKAQGIPHPTIFLLNKQGIIEAKLREESYRDRPTIEQIVAAANAMD